MVKYTAAECRDPTRWRRTKLAGAMVEFKQKDGQWTDVLRVGPSTHGRGLFAVQSYPAGVPVCAYFGKLVPAHNHSERQSDMIMASGVKEYVVKGRPSTSTAGAVFVHDARGSRKAANVKITVGSYNLRNHTQ